MRNIYLLFLLINLTVYSQKFEDNFTNKTLRLDFVFAGNAIKQHAFLNETILLDQWHGRRSNLDVVPIQGYGQIKIFNNQTNKLIYVLPFGSLFQEWLTLDEANEKSKSFENTFLIPYPKETIRVQISFFDKLNKEKIIATNIIDPNDILIRKVDEKHVDYEIIHKSSVNTPIKIAIVAEGYQADEMDIFMKYAHLTVENIFKHAVFSKYKNYFEIVAVKAISTDTGISVPSKNKWVNTAVQSHFDTFYSSRYLTTSNITLLHNQLQNIPYQHIIILANTDVYGGGGILNSYSLTTTKNKEFAPVVVHEFGHSFAGLADEYFYENDVFENLAIDKTEPWEKNITSLVDFESKWKNKLKQHTPIPTPINISTDFKIGVYEGFKGNGLYIPTLNCRMKTNSATDFCSVCSDAIEEMILFYTES